MDISVPMEDLKSMFYYDGADVLKQKFTELGEQLSATEVIKITGEHGCVIRSFTKDQAPDIPTWLQIYLSMEGDDH